MKKYIFPLLLFTGFVSYSNAQTVSIGSQVWMTKNLDVSTFRNGDSIHEAKSDQEWLKAGENKQPAWCYYENNPANGVKYGKLYNWFAVTDPRGLAPVGYHIPSDKEWTVLTDYLGGEEKAGNKMKSKDDPKSVGTGTNGSGFSGLLGGYRFNNDGAYYQIGRIGYWWSSTGDGPGYAWIRTLSFSIGGVRRMSNGKDTGFSVRCLRD